jgi:hypothetical protein
MSRTYAFEGDNVATLDWLPLDVRRKLDLVGLHVGLAAWQAIPLDGRRALVAHRVDRREDLEGFTREVRARTTEATGIDPVAFDDRPWMRPDALDRIRARAEALSIAIHDDRLAAAGEAERYALFRLSDPKKTVEKFRAALIELGIARA